MVERLIGRFLKWLDRVREENARHKATAYETNYGYPYDQPRHEPEAVHVVTEPTAPYPHCDSNVLHAPGACIYCDEYPQAQALRLAACTNFTGECFPHRRPCPSTSFRSVEIIERWSGNRPVQSDLGAAVVAARGGPPPPPGMKGYA